MGDLPINLEEWARRTVAEAPISEWEFGENLLRIGDLGRTYGFEPLRELIVHMTCKGFTFAQTLIMLERGDLLLLTHPESGYTLARE